MRALDLLLLLFAVIRVVEEAAADVVGEKEILLQFKGNVTADPRGALASWVDDGGNPCRDFAGVTCSDAGFVVKILIHGAELKGTLSSSVAGLSDLQILSLFGNRFSGGVPVEYGGIETLRKLNLSRNELSGGIPASLGNIPSLRLLDLGGNSFSGEIPGSLFKNCFRTRFVSFAHNRLSGSIPTSIANCFNLVGFNFSFNKLTGDFPPEICAPPAITFIALGNNSLSGTVTDKISFCRSLEFFDLGGNSFSGSVPFDLLSLTNLSYFNASFNRFQGIIPEIGTCSDKLKYIDVSGNDLSGAIDPSIANCAGLRFLDLGFNELTGNIPHEIGSIKYLSVLRLGSNAITGTIPSELGEMEMIQVLDLHNLQLSGEIPPSLTHCQFLLELDASRNKLQGGIPETISKMTLLEHLDLHHNELNGTIPSSLGQLIRLQFLDLSQNLLSGSIPPSLSNLSLLTHFNLSYNNLSGAIPSAPSIQQFGSSAFSNNPFLCGSPLNILCGGHRRAKVLSVTVIIAIVAAALILAGVCVVAVMNQRAYRKKSLEEEMLVSESTAPASTSSNIIIGKLVLFSKSLPSRYEDWEAGTKALLDKDCLIGGGSIGSVYKASFEGGVTIAVKKLETLGKIRNQEEFEQEMSRLGGMRHPNLVGFHGYYWSSTTQLILSEFVPNGSLHQHLHDSNFSSSSGGGRGQLFWSRRFDIALGTARALAYLHHDCKPQVLHLNIKSTNVLLGEGYEPKLSDYGLMKLLPILGSGELTKFHTAVGYVAPELASQSLRYSEKCDVYSFGIILLEIVTGRKPVESPGATQVVLLRDFVQGALDDGAVSDCFDRSLRRFSEREVIQVLKLGLFCADDAPAKRPSMGEVVQFLESIRSGNS
ncbi:probable LRR receptor-like serine/threonine-protein kinase At1g12460 [Phalaenopsis equestris]|uniref:probable LRR receptor-like serine/threonine-protein kinase At1g12460 n=1 Tax=Phalaenopsis equestris TaxID=78828 RepID=UPI0009E2CC9C|nr:probable LRR receptor-like serine/threonine-protein kinase At1g12460 [Phalaenopsis equestris]